MSPVSPSEHPDLPEGMGGAFVKAPKEGWEAAYQLRSLVPEPTANETTLKRCDCGIAVERRRGQWVHIQTGKVACPTCMRCDEPISLDSTGTWFHFMTASVHCADDQNSATEAFPRA